MNWTPQLQHQFGIEMNKELERVTMSWSNELKLWYPFAMKALNCASLSSLKINFQDYKKLFIKEDHGVNMNVVAALANNLETKSPNDMGVDVDQYKEILELNSAIAQSWEALAEPVRQRLVKRFELMDGNKQPKLVIAKGGNA